MTSIIKAQEKDFNLLATIGKRSFIESHGWSATANIIEEYVAKNFTPALFQKELQKAEHVYYIIYHNDQPAGYSKIIYNTPHPSISKQQVTKLERLYLLKEFYGLKLGFELFQFNLQLSKQHHQAGIWLYVWKENHRAIDFYTKTGFKIVDSGFFKLTDTHSNPNYIMFLEY